MGADSSAADFSPTCAHFERLVQYVLSPVYQQDLPLRK
jgi:hypothetical protein